MDSNLEKTQSPFEKILDSLGIVIQQLEPAAESEASYRIAFEKNFTVEISELSTSICRVSARICQLGKSLQVQEQQLSKAIEVFSALIEEAPNGLSLAVSDHDNCLRTIFEITRTRQKTQQEESSLFETFVNFSFAYKQTYFVHKAA